MDSSRGDVFRVVLLRSWVIRSGTVGLFVFAFTALSSCGSTVGNVTGTGRERNSASTLSRGIGLPPGGHRVVRIGGCLSEYGIKLARGQDKKAEALFGGREVLGRNGRPLSVRQYEVILRRCGLEKGRGSHP